MLSETLSLGQGAAAMEAQNAAAAGRFVRSSCSKRIRSGGKR